MERARGCLEAGALIAFALILGGFVTSTWLHHAEGERAAEEGETSAPSFAASERARIRVEVKNGSGIPGAAGRTTEYLRERGFDVVDFGNAERFDQERTRVIDRIGNPRKAREVAAALRGVPIGSDPDSSLYLDVTVVIGEDLDAVLAREEEAADRESGGWRGWLDRIPWPGS
ncbi:MAG: LytR C-terminal domain-containing protein [Gemmatimonadota bacterium]|nr:LytR C-terminal domain-containing protein [Gemmatimonadota bacterium]